MTEKINDPSAVHVEPARENNPDHENLREATAAWIEENPDAYGLFLKCAREMAAQGKPFGVKLLAERVRWEYMLRYSHNEYKLNNNHVAYIARRLIMDDQTLVRFIRFRKTQW